MKEYVTQLYDILEEVFMRFDDKDISLKNACIVGMGFGLAHGDQKLFKKIENIVALNFSNIDFKHMNMIFHGLIYNRRISNNLLTALKKK